MLENLEILSLVIMRVRNQLAIVGFLCIFLSCSTSKQLVSNTKSDEGVIRYEKKYDSISDTYYYLTHIKHTDNNGKLLKLQHAHAQKSKGETVVEFSQRMGNPILAMNASTMYRISPDSIKPNGVQIIKGEIVQDKFKEAYALGIKDNNELISYVPEKRAAAILEEGVQDALTAFMPLIENYKPVHDRVLAIPKHGLEKHPRQVIAQFENLDLLILSCGGRTFDGTGMTAKDLIRILKDIEVKFAYNLDGGGSVSTVINGERITKKIDENGTKDRLRPNFLYILKNE